ncbi:putative transmembrane protein [Gregarina niphandrodes]|uniref:Transmembrane protein n=1 Tax=Gregarina niphandrodes TaxID=110365 RepID=A0A023BBN8_GRENI|nr:putative transmembrane protein [Gregarina niphandrodes]EZG80253.1 putative transmembrane protein [Gregarina niphandrodes]|eukprot:XP_011134307.1 putative transmembrane protein [Gregarina niphandrodes]
MFIAESLCLVAHGLDLLYRKRVLKLPRGYGKFEFIDPPSSALLYRVTPWWWFALPSLCDILGTATINFAFTMTYASTVQLLRNSVMIFTALNTLVVMRRPLLVCEWTGIIIMTLGMVIAGAESLRNPEAESNHSGSAVLGIILTLLGTSLNACTLIFEEALLKKRYSPPLRAVGFAGITGIMWNLVALPIAHVCKIQNLEHGWHQLLSSATLKGSVMAFICSSFIFNSTGMFVTQLGSGLLKGLLYSCRAPIIWVVEILLRWQAYNRFGLIGLIATFGGFIVFTNVLKLGSFWTTPVGCGLTPKRPSVVLIPPSI